MKEGSVSHAIPNDSAYFDRFEQMVKDEEKLIRKTLLASILASGHPPATSPDSEEAQFRDLSLLMAQNSPAFWNDPRDARGEQDGPQATYARLAAKFAGPVPAVGGGGLLP